MKAKFSIVVVMIISISLCLLMACCRKLFPDEKLSLQRTDYTGNELRTDGYYYSYFEETGITAIFFLYRNGISLSAGSYLASDLNEIEKRIVNYMAKSKVDWGVFSVKEDAIQREKWVGSAFSRPEAYRLLYSGRIENDTTIHFTKVYSSETNKTDSIDQTWHFKQFDHKPDSTNNYIK